MPSKKKAPVVKTQESFDKNVKSLLDSPSGTVESSGKMKKRRTKKATTLVTPKKKTKVVKSSIPTIKTHTNHILELRSNTFEKVKFSLPSMREEYTTEQNPYYVIPMLQRNMIDFLQREKFYLDTLSASEKKKAVAFIKKDLENAVNSL